MAPGVRIVLSCWAFLLSHAALAESGGEKGSAHPLSPLDSGVLMETAWGLLLIIGLIVGLSWVFRRFGKRAFSGKGVVSILGGVSLGPRERAVVLQVGETRLLVGVAPGRVQTLHVLAADERVEGQERADSFKSRLKEQMGAGS